MSAIKWLKVAEDFIENLDTRAKLVVSELADEQSDSQSPASSGQGPQSNSTKPNSKSVQAQKRVSTNKSQTATDLAQDLAGAETLPLDIISDKDGATPSVLNERNLSSESSAETTAELKQNTEKDGSDTLSSETLANELHQHDADVQEVPVTAVEAEIPISAPNDDPLSEKLSDVSAEQVPSALPAKDLKAVGEDHPIDSGENAKSGESDVSTRVDQEKSQAAPTDSPLNHETHSKDADLKIEPPVNQKKLEEHKAVTPTKLQEQLDEAQGLLKSTKSSGQSKEARLARVCAGLQTRLQEYKSENAQLEELLISERELSKSYEAHIKQLQQDLSTSKDEATRIESNMAEALAAKNAEIEALINSVDALKKQAALSEGNLASLQANMESMMRNRELTETRMMQALREELASAERRAQEERAAHNAAKMAAREREVELEHRAVEVSTALARIQRIADERTAKAAELEQKVALLEVECSSLNQELQDMETRARREQKKSPEEANQVIQMQAWQEEVERARQAQRDAESKLSSSEASALCIFAAAFELGSYEISICLLQAELQKMRVEMAAMKRDAEHYSRQEHMELEKRYRELTDLLYYKQTQLEAMASEKAAAEYQLEKEVKRLQEAAQIEAERARVSRRPSTSWEEDAEMKALEPLPLYQRHMVGATIQLQNAAKLLDTGAARATRFFWRYPTARLMLLFYLVFVHLFLMYLLHRLQEQADNFADREVAKSMGLANSTLP
ncbi:hypothetical protein Tsubulata_021452 [Turnera subulata]|uniref:Golgin candidate 1 n=1 Tax=Turnera subulata TaxID=218843 RepID=A0A9Q0FW67_9ROSI|nr:hypothetical protein Tsubulata_021452 [Turnera subulata]